MIVIVIVVAAIVVVVVVVVVVVAVVVTLSFVLFVHLKCKGTYTPPPKGLYGPSNLFVCTLECSRLLKIGQQVANKSSLVIQTDRAFYTHIASKKIWKYFACRISWAAQQVE